MPLAGVPVCFPHDAPERIAGCHQRSRGFGPLSAQATCIYEHRSNLERVKIQPGSPCAERLAPPLPVHLLFLSAVSTVFPRRTSRPQRVQTQLHAA